MSKFGEILGKSKTAFSNATNSIVDGYYALKEHMCRNDLAAAERGIVYMAEVEEVGIGFDGTSIMPTVKHTEVPLNEDRQKAKIAENTARLAEIEEKMRARQERLGRQENPAGPTSEM